MVNLLVNRFAGLILTIISVSLILFMVLEINGDNVAVKVLGQFSSQEQRESWLEENGYNRNAFIRYGEWLGKFFTGDLGRSTRYKTEIGPLLADRLANTGILAGLTMLFMIPLSLLLGVIAGKKSGLPTEKGISLACIITSSIPEFASSVFLASVFVYLLEWLPGVSSMYSGFDWREMVLPVSVLVLYSFGYITRMTITSVDEVNRSNYVRTAVLKGVNKSAITFRHILRNALLTPITVILLQIPWLLSGVIVVEYFFAYKGFGALLLEASLNDDIYLIEACAMVSVVAVVISQIIADISYTLLNPRIRFR